MAPDDDSASPSASPNGGTVVDHQILAGRYRLERRIGQGGMAEVWVATDIQLDRKVALKWLRPSLASDSVVAERFRREAIAVARLNHPNIVAVHDVFVHDGRQAVVMQLVDGKSLRQLLDAQKRLGPELTIHIGACVAAALDEAHRAGFVHRDVKPGNILVTSDGRVLLTDFGIAKGLDGIDDDLTSDNVMMGTAKYLSPEQVRGKKLDGRADIYGLGLVLYECLAGRVPFLGETDADTALARLQRDPTDLGRLRPTLPPGLIDLVHRMLARNPAHRPANGAELRSALLAVDTAPPRIDGTPAEPPRRLPRVIGTPTGSERPAIPGEPTSVTGSNVTPVSASSATTGMMRVNAPPPPRREATPTEGAARRGRPAKGLHTRQKPVTITLLALALVAVVVVGLVLLSFLGGDDEANPPVTVVPATDAPVASAPAVVPVEITSVTAWDPDGDNGGENDTQADAVLADGDPDTGWATECYSSQYLGGKRGVGLVVALSTASAGTVSVDSLNAPYQLELYASSAETAPADPDGWGAPLAPKAYATEPGTVAAPAPEGTRHLLVWLRELGPDDACSESNPYRGRLGELTFVP
ncbi:MAG: protein kinase [Ilumatobacteraceae bacterium]|jgi:serine/threonine-protein kinase|nr:protein kinase [Ilumatobacteraceae bacterium]